MAPKFKSTPRFFERKCPRLFKLQKSRRSLTGQQCVRTAVTEYCGHDVTSPPCKEMPLSTTTSMPPASNKPETVSNESSSARLAATSGRYHPTGGAALRTRR